MSETEADTPQQGSSVSAGYGSVVRGRPQHPEARRPSARRALIRAGVQDLARAERLLADEAIVRLLPSDADRAALLADCQVCADPDAALLSLTRLAEALSRPSQRPHPGSDSLAEARRILSTPGEARQAVLALLGASEALADFLISHPEHCAPVCREHVPADRDHMRRLLTQTVTDCLGSQDGITAAIAALRVTYRHILCLIARDDVLSPYPDEHVRRVGEQMADLVDATLDAGLLLARHALIHEGVSEQDCERVALSVIALGKTGARELNYISDVDVVYVVGPAAPSPAGETRHTEVSDEGGRDARDGGSEAQDGADSSNEGADRHDSRSRELSSEELTDVGTRLATFLAHITSATGPEPPLWPLDTALRPEGKDGALVRTLESHVEYYRRWASSWEFQALLKARACAGDPELGRAYEEALFPLVWDASRREGFVDDARSMRQRVERESRDKSAVDRRIKLGPGGLRDVEFTVQLLQLVHGRADATLRHRSTLNALEALSEGGYVARSDAAELSRGYRLLRLLEHRTQLIHMRRTHDLPSSDAALRRVGRGIAVLDKAWADPAQLWERFTALRRTIRSLHRDIYYRPLLTMAAPLSADELRMTAQAARDRLHAAGFRDPEGAMRHIQALTSGVSRRAAIQRQLLPVIIGWLGQGADPDFGLLAFRRLSDDIGSTHWFLAMLRDSPVAAQRLCHITSGARWTTEYLAQEPEAVAWLASDSDLQPRSRESVHGEIDQILKRRRLGFSAAVDMSTQVQQAVDAISRVRSRERLRAALADCLDGIDAQRSSIMLTQATDVLLDGVLRVALAMVVYQRAHLSADVDHPEPVISELALADHAIIAMGRYGGGEIGLSSDADVLFVHRAKPGVDPHAAAAEAQSVATMVIRLLAQASHPLAVDADLRPEGKQGPMSRSLESYTEYYTKWAATWERHALLRARAAAGDAQLGAEFIEMINPLRYPAEGLSEAQMRDIRHLKARMEAERLPRGVSPARHLKLGPGGLSDVEWAAQVLQLTHAGAHPSLRTTSTLEALRAAGQLGLITPDEVGQLMESWILATRLRTALVIGTGRQSGARADVLPTVRRDMVMVARLLHFGQGREDACEDLYLRCARHARRIVEQIVFGVPAASPPPSPATVAVAPGKALPASSRTPGAAPSGPVVRPGAESSHSTVTPGVAPSGPAVRAGTAPSHPAATPGAESSTPSGPPGTSPSARPAGKPTEKATERPPVKPAASRPVKRPLRRRSQGPYPWS